MGTNVLTVYPKFSDGKKTNKRMKQLDSLGGGVLGSEERSASTGKLKFNFLFLDASSHLYVRLCPSVRPSPCNLFFFKHLSPSSSSLSFLSSFFFFFYFHRILVFRGSNISERSHFTVFARSNISERSPLPVKEYF